MSAFLDFFKTDLGDLSSNFGGSGLLSVLENVAIVEIIVILGGIIIVLLVAITILHSLKSIK